MTLLQNKTTISSLELVEQINIFRREDGSKNDLRHDTMMSIIRDEFEEEIGIQEILETPYIHPQNGQTYKMFELTLNQAKQVLVRESKIVRKAVIAHIEKLENELSSQNLTKKETLLIQLFSSDAMEVASAHKELVALETTPLIEKIQEQAPKAEFYDAVTDSKDAIDMGSAAKVLNFEGIGRNKLFEILRDHGVLMNNNTPYQSMIDREFFKIIEVKYQKPNGDTCINIKTLVLQKGLDYILKLLKSL